MGVDGSGSLTVSNGGHVTNVDGYTGANTGSTGTAIVDGLGSSWKNSGDLYVGATGTGSLAITAGGTVTNQTGYIGYDTGSSGTVTVDGAGSKWTSGPILVGYQGTGSLTISNGGNIASSGDSYVAFLQNSAGNVTITGTGSNWTSSGNLYVGHLGKGTMTVSNGGSVKDSSGWIGDGDDVGATGNVTVTGTGSSWTSDNFLSKAE